ncbi:trichohyalin-like [Dorcoceras hygrometricum]|uniref:Trichohyalin-like n=1 Tax=Dorcoceras hygrometricum TaxID=472368 RepID=A0A2Z7A9I8_9LAMI|nr:trichohyalin-like [Dorcoceras hygrometricum]
MFSYIYLSEMASSLISNAVQVNFDSVLGIPDNKVMVMMFRTLVSTGLSGFLGCPSILYEQELDQFFDTAFVKDNEIICAVQGKFFGVSEEMFAGMFELPTTGLTDVDDVPKNLVYDARSIFLNLVNRFRPPTIHFGLKINWSKILFDILKGMVTKTSKQAKGFAAQICALLKSAPNLTMGERKRTTTGRAAPEAKSLALVSVAQEAVPIQMISSVTPAAPKCKAPKMKLKLPVGSNDEIVEKEPDVESVVEQQREKTIADDMDKIIDQILTETAQMEIDMEEHG